MSREAQAREWMAVAAVRCLPPSATCPECVQSLTALLDAVAEEGRREGIGEAATVVLNSPLMTIGECLVLSGQVRALAKGKP